MNDKLKHILTVLFLIFLFVTICGCIEENIEDDNLVNTEQNVANTDIIEYDDDEFVTWVYESKEQIISLWSDISLECNIYDSDCWFDSMTDAELTEDYINTIKNQIGDYILSDDCIEISREYNNYLFDFEKAMFYLKNGIEDTIEGNWDSSSEYINDATDSIHLALEHWSNIELMIAQLN